MAENKHELSDLTACTPKSAKVEGVISLLSYEVWEIFDGCLTNGSRSIQLVGFDTKRQEKLAEMQQSKQSV